MASDVIRDGLGLELLDGAGRVVAEVFRCDRDHSVTIRAFDETVPDDVLADLVESARQRLGAFEDGSSLPEIFAFERVV